MQPDAHENVACPFCGLLCDDLTVRVRGDVPEVVAHGCELSISGFAAASSKFCAEARPSVSGKSIALASAVKRSAELIAGARHPLFVCQGTDVAGARAVMALADRCGAVVDHSHSTGLFRNLSVLQDRGWMTATLTEVRNRAETVVIAGSEVFRLFPRLADRVLNPDSQLFRPKGERKKLVLLGPWREEALPAEIRALKPTIISAPLESLGEIMAVLRSLLRNRAVPKESIAGVTMTDLKALSQQMSASPYAVLAWAAGEFDFANADLTLQQFAEYVRELNVVTRASGFPLGGNRADMTLNQVCVWQSGYPLRTDFQRGAPRFDPLRNDHRRLLSNGEADLLLWISALDPEATPPATDVPVIVLGHAAMRFEPAPEVFMPVGTPGVDHAGHFYRSDNVVAIPLRALKTNGAPAVGQVLALLEQSLGSFCSKAE